MGSPHPPSTQALSSSTLRETAPDETRAARLVWWAVLIATAVLLTAFHYTMTSPWKLAAPGLMAGFEAAAPFQYRLLLPAVAAFLDVLLPLGVELLLVLMEAGAWIVMVVVAYRALAAFGIGSSDTTRRFLALTVVIPAALQLIPPDIKIVSIFEVDGGMVRLGDWRAEQLFHYMYDLPSAVFILGLVLLLWRFVRTLELYWFMAYLGMFAIATVNRETTLFMIPAFLAVCYPILGRHALAGAITLQIVAFAAIQLTVQSAFADSINPHANVPGTNYENHLLGNLALFANPLYLVIYLARLGAGLYLPVLLLHRHLHPFLLRILIGYGIPFLAAAFLFGRLQEHRVLIEIVPLLWLAAVQVIAAWMRAGAGATDDPRSRQRPVRSAVAAARPAAPALRNPVRHFKAPSD